MKFYLGIDGGGTKTAFALANEKKEVLAQIEKTGCSYLEIGKEGVVSLLSEGVSECLKQANVERCEAICIGLPCFGENQLMDEVLTKELSECLPSSKVKLVNDAIVGWAGSLNGKEGIHLVAGTGSLAIGKGMTNEFARSGGWNEFFGDEGSCYWVGRQAMQVFSKQADGRIKKGPLYHLVKKTYQLKADFEFIDYVLTVKDYRDQVAAFQRIALAAANNGDESVQKIYEDAADELFEMVKSVKNQLKWSAEIIPVSYYGGLFHAQKWVLPQLEKRLKEIGCHICQPYSSAVQGAVLLALENEKTPDL
ncbi:MAG: hypothetical protein IJC38_07380 [Erysipelotrichaceae bacterium]|nr:hypothetical protein [Erysipelotrichaceae bacterium]